MFGIRTKDDVIMSAEVINSLHELYRRERQSVAINGAFSMTEADKPMTLSVSDGTHTVTLSGAVAEKAQNRPASEDNLRSKLEKTGGTPFYFESDLPTPTLDEECDMYDLASDMLGKAGYEHYEISNYAKIGKRSRHNSLYWHFDEYIGVGAAAHSFFKGKRFFNTDDVTAYINGSEKSYIDEVDVDHAYEYAMLGLRLKEGISLSDYKSRFGKSFTEGKEAVIERFLEEGLLKLTDEGIALTERGFYISNSILIEIL